MSNLVLQVVTQEHPLATELDFEEEFIHDDDDLSSDSDGGLVTLDPSITTDAIDSAYLVSSHCKYQDCDSPTFTITFCSSFSFENVQS